MAVPDVLSDDQIRAMAPDERRELVRRLLGLEPVVVDPAVAARRRHRLLLLLTGGCAVLIPWILFLAFSLPRHYETGNWRQTWVGFDILLLASLAVTAYLGWRRRQLVLLASFASGLLLVCDSWFDITTARGADRWEAVASAVLVELPVAAILLRVTYDLLRLTVARRLGGVGPHTLWRMPVIADEGQHPGHGRSPPPARGC